MTSPVRRSMYVQSPSGTVENRNALSARDLAAVERTLALILDPFAHASIDHWRASILRELMPVLGADKSAFLLPLHRQPSYLAVNVHTKDLASYPSIIQPLDIKLSVWERQAQLGAFDRQSLWHGHQRMLLKSPYYNEFVIPERLFDALGLTARIANRSAGPSTAATIWFHHDRDSGRRFGDRGLAILRLLVSAVSAAARAINQFVDHAESLARTIDSLGVAAAIYDFSGCLVHRTPRLAALLSDEPGRGDVLDAAREVALSLVSIPEFRTAKARYRIEAILGGATLSQTGCRVIVSITARDTFGGAPQLGKAQSAVAERFDMTPREQEVSLLIAEGLNVEEITAKLGISRHTVRHHVERVFQKLGVHTHAAACARVRSIVSGQEARLSDASLRLAEVSGAGSTPARRADRAREES